jgi:hypothetical protein
MIMSEQALFQNQLQTEQKKIDLRGPLKVLPPAKTKKKHKAQLRAKQQCMLLNLLDASEISEKHKIVSA